MIFFVFLFFCVFFALVFFGIASVTRLLDSQSDGLLDVGVSGEDVRNALGETQVERILNATIERSEGEYHSAPEIGKLNILAYKVSTIESSVRKIQVEALVFKLMIAGLALIFGFVAAFIALVKEVDRFF